MEIKFEDDPIKTEDGTWTISKKDEDTLRRAFFRENIRTVLRPIIEYDRRIAKQDGEEPCFAPGLEKILGDVSLFETFLSSINPKEKTYLSFAELVIDNAFPHLKEYYKDAVDDIIGTALINMKLFN